MEAEEFIKPPEAPVFQPTHEEFKDPIAYLSKIRPVVLNTGICKIKPPSGWRPPFSVNIEKFRFTPRLQPLNELDAKTRVKLNFLDNLYKFWDMQGISFKIPNVGRTPLDLHKLYKVVTRSGGFEEVCRCRRWTNIAREMQYDNVNVSGSLRVHYEKLLYPYEAFAVTNGQIKLEENGIKGRSQQQSSSSDGDGEGTMVQEVKMEHHKQQCSLQHRSHDVEDMVIDEHDVVNDTPEKLRRSRRKRMEDPDYAFELAEDNPEFKKLAFVSPGIKNAFAPLKRSARKCISKKDRDDTMEWDYGASDTPSPVKMEPKEEEEDDERESAAAVLQRPPRVKPLICEECGSDANPESLLFCRGCDLVYHPFCLVPRLPAAPVGVWYCPDCISKECCQPQEAFGFEQAKKEYSLRSFGQMANQFKTNYFNKQPTNVPFSTVEKEFWRLVRSIDDDVTVEYGADLHSSNHGSGFPMCEDFSSDGSQDTESEELMYSKSGWNLNNIPNLKGSVLRHIDANISGMKVPWLYVGMCFSCFCWHTEDHWSYSINYLHWGEPKTWYGVPSAYAEALERTMKDQAPELFDNQPDLMHHLATTMSPTVLIKNGIPVVRTDQCAGEFVVTFPRAYHAGFNQGFNFAEAVNFSLADWLPIGRQSVSHYRDTQKHPVFSHDELICKMIAQPNILEVSLLLMAAKDANTMIREEEDMRLRLKEMGIVNEQREAFELSMEDDDRQCHVCKTICFLSGVRCSCNSKILACPSHFNDICSCPVGNKSFRYRHTLDELHELVSIAQKKANVFCVWSEKVEKLLDGFERPKPNIEFMRDLKSEAERQSLLQCEQYQELCSTILEAERLQRDVYRMGQKDSVPVMTVTDLKTLIEDVESLPCTLLQIEAVKARLNDVLTYQSQVSAVLTSLAHLSNSKEGIKVLRDLLEKGESMSVELAEISDLRNAINQVLWISETQDRLSGGQKIHIDWLRTTYKKGCTLSGCPAVENVQNRVKSLLSMIQEWEQKMRAALKEKPPCPITFFETMLVKAREIPVTIPLAETVSQTLQLAKQWTVKAQQMQVTDKDPHYDLLKDLLSSSRPLAVRLDQLPQVESRYSAAKAWVDRAGRTFMKKNSTSSLIEILLPRTLATCSLAKASKMKKKQDDEFSIITTPLTPLSGDRLKEMSKIKEMEREEKLYLQSIRKSNTEKQRESNKDSGSSPVVYCLCRKPESGYMLQCEVCNEWYHAHCLHIPKSKLSQETDISKDMRFICGGCLRSRRPRLDSIVSLLISLQKVPVAISEGTALHCLAERAISWQKKAREVLITIRGVVDAGRGQQLRLIDLRKKIMKWKDEAASNKTTETEIQAQLASQAGSVLKHYEAQLNKEKSTYLGMTEAQRKKIEDLLLEGDLLEVTTDETTQIWQLLQTDSECSSYFTLSEEEALKCDLPKLSLKKPTVVCEEVDEDASTNPKKRKRVERSTTPSNKPAVAPPDNTALPMTKKKKVTKQTVEKKKKPSPVPKSKTTPSKQSSSQKHGKVATGGGKSGSDPLGCNEQIPDEEEEAESSDEEKMEDAACSADQCIRPTSSEVNWVQCDTCQLWYHLVCVGLTSESVRYIEAYHCFPCKQKRAKQAAAAITTATGSSTAIVTPSQSSGNNSVTASSSFVSGSSPALVSAVSSSSRSVLNT